MSELTLVELLWLKKRIENWIRFGRIAEEHVLDRQRRIVSFAPDSVCRVQPGTVYLTALAFSWISDSL